MMRAWKTSLLLSALTLASLCLPVTRAGDEVSVKVVTYPELAETIRQLRGKVVVVNLWAEW